MDPTDPRWILPLPVLNDIRKYHRIDCAAELTAAAEREQALRDEVERLRGKCNRLVTAITEKLEDDHMGMEGQPWEFLQLHVEKHWSDAVEWGDMTPEPHGAASEGEE